jgi:hypothetical protein
LQTFSTGNLDFGFVGLLLISSFSFFFFLFSFFFGDEVAEIVVGGA